MLFWPHSGTIKCKIARASGGFSPWTPTKALPLMRAYRAFRSIKLILINFHTLQKLHDKMKGRGMIFLTIQRGGGGGRVRTKQAETGEG